MVKRKAQATESFAKQEMRSATQKNEQEKADKVRQKRESDTRRAYVQVAKTEAGRLVFRDLMRQCGFLDPSVNVDPTTGSILTDNTVYNEARRNLWLTTRKRIPVENLVKIEFNLEMVQHDDDENLETE